MPLGENLIQKGVITAAQLNQALEEQKKTPAVKLGEILVKLGFASDDQIKSAL